MLATRLLPDQRPSFGQSPDQDTEKAANEGCAGERAPSGRTGAGHTVEQLHPEHATSQISESDQK